MRVARHQELGDQARPSGLVRGADPTAVVAMEVFVEEDMVAKVWIGLQPRMITVTGASACPVQEKNAIEPQRKLIGDLVERQEGSRARGAFDFEVITVVVMKLLQRLDDEKVDRKPYGAAPVGIATEYRGVRFPRLVAYAEVHAVNVVTVRLISVHARHRAHSIG